MTTQYLQIGGASFCSFSFSSYALIHLICWRRLRSGRQQNALDPAVCRRRRRRLAGHHSGSCSRFLQFPHRFHLLSETMFTNGRHQAFQY